VNALKNALFIQRRRSEIDHILPLFFCFVLINDADKKFGLKLEPVSCVSFNVILFYFISYVRRVFDQFFFR
jgi:hypothetical protein